MRVCQFRHVGVGNFILQVAAKFLQIPAPMEAEAAQRCGELNFLILRLT